MATAFATGENPLCTGCRLLFPFLAAIFLSLLYTDAAADTTVKPIHVGRDACKACHSEQFQQWVGSHHDLAMQTPSRTTVLGDFGNVGVSSFGASSRFFRADDKYQVRTEGPTGEPEIYEIKYTFGAYPLQQYLIELPEGRLQALRWAWDARPTDQGGQHWFDLYPSERISPDDPLHWTQADQNWNYMCAECHSTNVQKNYDPTSRAYATTWTDIDVSCEACHGPGSAHIDWAKREPKTQVLDDDKGLVIALDERKVVRWTIDAQSGNAARSPSKAGNKEIEMCARCHARRTPISQKYIHGTPFLDHYIPSLLADGVYELDGQIREEVYVYGSFIQSKMYQAGVTCSDCHNAHSLSLRAPGNGVCLQCHAADKYDQPEHHHHQVNASGASCIACHMPVKTYLIVDPRHDHSIRIPRPDFTARFGTPNACNLCHADRDAAWAAAKIKTWYGRIAEGHQSFAQAFYNARHGEPGAATLLAALIGDARAPAIARATALSEIARYVGPETIDVLKKGLSDDDPLVRQAAVGSLETLPADLRLSLALPLLDDPVRAVRIQTARILADVAARVTPPNRRASLREAITEYIDAQQVNGERAEAQSNLGMLYSALGNFDRAVTAYQTAIALDPKYAPAYINLADFHRGRDDEVHAEKVLRDALDSIPDNADVQHALGLALVRQSRMTEAFEALRLAVALDANNPRYAYVYAVALNSAGEPTRALKVLKDALVKAPNDPQIISTLASIHRDQGELATARIYAERLRALSPWKM